jgi:hypothetical protein
MLLPQPRVVQRRKTRKSRRKQKKKKQLMLIWVVFSEEMTIDQPSQLL